MDGLAGRRQVHKPDEGAAAVTCKTALANGLGFDVGRAVSSRMKPAMAARRRRCCETDSGRRAGSGDGAKAGREMRELWVVAKRPIRRSRWFSQGWNSGLWRVRMAGEGGRSGAGEDETVGVRATAMVFRGVQAKPEAGWLASSRGS